MLRKIMGIIWTFIAVVLLAILLAVLFGGRFTGVRNFLNFFKVPVIHVGGIKGGSDMENASRELTLSGGINEVKADISSLYLEVYSGSGSDIVVHFYNGAEESTQVESNGGVLTVKETKVLRIFSFKAPKVSIMIPKRNLNAISVEKTSGSCSITGFDLDSLEIESSSGSITLDDVKAKRCSNSSTSGSTKMSSAAFDDLTIKAHSGSIKLEGVKAQNAEIEATSGSIKLTDVDIGYLKSHGSSGSFKAEGKIYRVDLSASSGSISLTDTVALNGESSFETHSGSIKLYLVPSPDYFIETKVSSGSVKNNLDSNRMGSVPIHVKASSGSIRIDRQ